MTTDQSKERDVKIGLANNLFGAAAGGVATAQAGVAARGAWKNRNLSPEQQKKAAEKAKNSPGKARKVFRKLPEGVQKPVKRAAKSRWTVPGLAVGNVAMQLANGGMDGQSAQYFGRELRDMKREEKAGVTKSQSLADFYERPERQHDGEGTNLNVERPEPVSKEILYATPREKNPHWSRNNAGAAALGVGSVGAAGYAAKQVKRIDQAVGDINRSQRVPVRDAQGKPKKYPRTGNYETRELKLGVTDAKNPLAGVRGSLKSLLSNPNNEKSVVSRNVANAQISPEKGKQAREALNSMKTARRRGAAGAAAAVGLAGAATAAHKLGGSKERNRWT